MKKVGDFPISIQVDDNPLRKKDSRFLCNVRFKNDLPEIPSDPKMLLSQLNLDELGAFKLFSNEKELKRDVRFPVDMGLPLSSLYIEQYDVYSGDKLQAKDAALLDLAGDVATEVGSRKRKSVPNAPWLMRTKYISGDSGAGGPRKQRAHGWEDHGDGSEAERIRSIEKSFEDARATPVHPTDKDLKPIEIKSLLPDDPLEDWKLVLVNFDSNPVEAMKLADSSVAEKRKWSQSLHLKTLKSAQYGRFAVLLAPRDCEDASYGEEESIPGEAFMGDYDWMRTYNENVRVEENGQMYLFRVGKDCIRYSDLSSRLFLRKRKKSVAAGDADDVESLKPEKMVLVPEDIDD
jgi:RNA polymerase II-associated factor 1